MEKLKWILLLPDINGWNESIRWEGDMRCMQHATEAVYAWDFHAECAGKSSLIMAVASELRLPIYVMSPFGLRWFRDVYGRMDTRHDGKGAWNERGKFAKWGIDMWILLYQSVDATGALLNPIFWVCKWQLIFCPGTLIYERSAKVGYAKGF